MNRYDENFNQEIVDMYNKGEKSIDIINKLGCSKGYVYKILHDYNVILNHNWNTRESQFKDSDVSAMYELYQTGKCLREIGEKYGITKTTVSFLFKKYGYNTRNSSDSHRKYTIDETFFDNIDTQEKAYCLGLLYADGTNLRRDNSIQIGLQEQDKDLLEKVRIAMNINKPLYFQKNTKSYGQNTYRLEFVSKHMSERLSDIGMVPNKSLILEFPTCVPEELMSHYLRGYMDGDGYISHRKNDYTVEIMGTESFCLSIQKILFQHDIDSKIYNTTLHKETSTRRLYIGRKDNFKKFINYIYTDATIYLERKYLTAMLKINYNINNSLPA